MLNKGVLRQSIDMSIQNIKSNKMRSFLTMLGIIIGVASVIALITIVQSVTDNVLNEFSGLGAGTLTVNASGTPLRSGLSESEIEELRLLEGVEGVSPTASIATTAVYGTEVFDDVTVEGKDEIYYERNLDKITAGRALTKDDMSGNTFVCIVDQDFVENVLIGQTVIGTNIELNGYQYNIIGVKEADDSLMGGNSDDSELDGVVQIPYRNALTMAGKENINNLDVYVNENYDTTQVEEALRSKLDGFYNEAEDSYSVLNMESLMDTMSSIQSMLSTMLAGIASIALVVGGIGIMNMMLVSVSERTKEIGLRKALGAEPFRIQSQFLIEAIVLSVVGGLIGVGVGLLIAFVAAIALDSAFSISTAAIMIGVGFSAAVGIIFGWIPAKRASELNPIDALRSE